jgi:hypothetical protein
VYDLPIKTCGLPSGNSSVEWGPLVMFVGLYIPFLYIPAGKHTESYGKSPLLMGKSTISLAIFNSKL